MRLTLRTMLAYMDGILEPEDAQDIGKKIGDSQYASGLMHRVRDVMRRLRLAAPGLSDRGPNLDSNTVAEYLDNTLADDRVPDFEKVCLESDIHLAEVGSCHQILTLVLGEPAEIDPASRERMYRIPEVLSAQVAAEQRITTAPQLEERAPATPVEVAPKRARPEVPDYLRESRKKRQLVPMLVGLAVVLLVVVAILFASNQFAPSAPLGRVIGMLSGAFKQADEPESAPADKPATTPAKPADGQTAGDQKAPVKPAADGSAANGSAVDANLQITRLPDPANVSPTPEPSLTPFPSPIPGMDHPVVPGGDQVLIGPGEATVGSPVVGPVENGGTKPVKPRGSADTAAPGQPAENAVAVGRLTSDKQVVLILNPKLDGYGRVPSKAVFSAGSRLLVLPTYRPEIALSAGAHLRLLGPTEVMLLSGDQQSQAGANVFFGRMMIMPLANPGIRLRLTVGSRTGVLTLPQAESVAALEVALKHVPGSDPEKTAAQVVSTLYVVSGEVLWDDPTGIAPVRITAPESLMIDAQTSAAPSAVSELPKWIQGETLGLLDARASSLVEQMLQTDKPALTMLMELDDHRQKEIRWLAARSLVYLDRFEALVGGLNQPDMKAEWGECAARLNEALALGPDTAAAIREEFRKKYGPEGAEAYRMLWGYTDETLQSGGAAKLVRFLDHDILAFRVLSYLNLKEITGAGLFYRPEQSAALRKQSTQRWKEKLASGEIRLKVAGGSAVMGVPPEPTADSMNVEPK